MQPVGRQRIGLVVVALVAVSGVVDGVLSVVRAPGGFLTTTDVGELEQLSALQAKLRPLDACSIRYALRDKHGHRSSTNKVFVEACSHGANDDVIIAVPRTWGEKDVGFELKRSGVDDRFKILVEKSEVPFPDCVAALEDLMPRVVAAYPAELARVRIDTDAADLADAQRRAADEARKQGASQTWPTK